MRELVIDNFAGGGGASLGIEWALGRPVDIAINHCPYALGIHRLNHPKTEHVCEDLLDVDPVQVCGGRPVGLAWFSPDCTHFSRAKGGKPVSKRKRALAWVVIRWAATVRPRVIVLENVAEFQTWGPLRKGRPCPRRKGYTFNRWLEQLHNLGYNVEYRELMAADYGAPTSRKRFFLVARCDGEPIDWPEATHGPDREHPWRTAAECIDWSLPCPSIFERPRPLAENTLRRIAKGIQRYVVEAGDPFIVAYYGPRRGGEFRGQALEQPLATQTTENRFGLVTPYLVANNTNNVPRRPDEPLGTVTGGNRHYVTAAFLAKHYGGMVGHGLERPVGTVTTKDHHSLVTSFLTKYYGTNIGSDLQEPIPTITARGNHIGEVRAFLLKYYGTAVGQDLREPMHTLTAKHRMGLVTVLGEEYQIVDIGMRMLQPRELARAHGFPESYQLPGTKAQQVALIGNSVPPVWAEMLVKANYRSSCKEAKTRRNMDRMDEMDQERMNSRGCV